MRRGMSIANKGICILFAVLLAFFGMSLTATPAAAVNSTDLAISDAEAAVSSTKISLDEAQARLDKITSDYNELNSEIDKMQEEIDSLAGQVLEAQEAMLAGRDALSDTAVYEYRNSTMNTIINVLLGSQNLSELTTNMNYISQIMDHQAEEIETQKQLRSDLESASEELTAQKNEQESMLVELDRKQDEAQDIVSRISAEYTANSEHLAALKSQADRLRRQEAQATQEVDPSANTIDRPSNAGDGATSSSTGSGTAPIPVTSTPSNSTSGSSSGGSSSGEGWRTGLATAYGGSSDPYTPNPGTTATGATCNDYSMGVAVPLAWSNYRSYFGRTVEIVYGGRTVYATVNDCGGMQGGRVSLDLQPGVFKAFGYSNCQSWGIRTVQYRFL